MDTSEPALERAARPPILGYPSLMLPRAPEIPLIRFGTSSFSSKDWVGPFYPEGTPAGQFLRVYASRYDTVEIDSTYYAVPSRPTVEGWAEKTPPGFLIAAKFPRDIVHGGKDREPDPGRVLDPDLTYGIRDRFLETLRILGPRLGPLVIQFPYFRRTAFPSPAPFFERLDRFLGDLPGGFAYAVEVRNRDWMNADLGGVCDKHGAALVLVDQAWMPHGDEVEKRMDPVSADFAYVRLLGDRQAIEAVTTTWDREVIDQGERLDRWAKVLARLLTREVPTVVYVNNHYAGHAPATVERLRERFRKAAEDLGLDPRKGLPRPSAN